MTRKKYQHLAKQGKSAKLKHQFHAKFGCARDSGHSNLAAREMKKFPKSVKITPAVMKKLTKKKRLRSKNQINGFILFQKEFRQETLEVMKVNPGRMRSGTLPAKFSMLFFISLNHLIFLKIWI